MHSRTVATEPIFSSGTVSSRFGPFRSTSACLTEFLGFGFPLTAQFRENRRKQAKSKGTNTLNAVVDTFIKAKRRLIQFRLVRFGRSAGAVAAPLNELPRYIRDRQSSQVDVVVIAIVVVVLVEYNVYQNYVEMTIQPLPGYFRLFFFYFLCLFLIMLLFRRETDGNGPHVFIIILTAHFQNINKQLVRG